jgi:hypothetical protein
MAFSDLITKLGRGQTLSAGEVESLRQEAQAIDEIKALVKTWVQPGTSTPIFQPPMETIYSQILNTDTASLTIQIPNAYKHLLILGAGRTNGAGTSSQYLYAQFNEDTGTNYINQFFTAVAAALTGTRTTGQDHVIIGALAEGGRAAGDVASFFGIIPHYSNSDLNKNLLAFSTPPFGALIVTASNWDSVSPISSLTLMAAADDIAAGSVISVYGLK